MIDPDQPPDPQGQADIRTEAVGRCLICGREGQVLYSGLEDRIFDTPGRWTMKKCPDPACGLLWLDPRPRAEEAVKLYDRYYTHQVQLPSPTSRKGPIGGRSLLRNLWRYLRRGCWALGHGYGESVSLGQRLAGAGLYLCPPLRMAAESLLRGVKRCGGGRLLDVGCGNGEFMDLMARLGWEVEGLDIDPRAVRAARSRGLTVHLGSLAQVGLPAGRHDAVTLIHLLEHLPDPLADLTAAGRLLRPGGRLHLISPNAASLGHARFGPDWRGLEPPRHFHTFTPASLRRLLQGLPGFSWSLSTPAAAAWFMFDKSSGPKASRLARQGFSLGEMVRVWAGQTVGEELAATGVKD